MSLALRAALKTDLLNYDPSLFIGNFLTVVGLLFSLLIGNTFVFLYTQQESIFLALFHEALRARARRPARARVVRARAALRSLSPRASFARSPRPYRARAGLGRAALAARAGRARLPRPAELYDAARLHPRVRARRPSAAASTCRRRRMLSARPQDDPLEAIMYMTSVGTPSTVYDTVKALRALRAARISRRAAAQAARAPLRAALRALRVPARRVPAAERRRDPRRRGRAVGPHRAA